MFKSFGCIVGIGKIVPWVLKGRHSPQIKYTIQNTVQSYMGLVHLGLNCQFNWRSRVYNDNISDDLLTVGDFFKMLVKIIVYHLVSYGL